MSAINNEARNDLRVKPIGERDIGICCKFTGTLVDKLI